MFRDFGQFLLWLSWGQRLGISALGFRDFGFRVIGISGLVFRDLGVSENRGPYCSTLNTRIFNIRTPK